MVASRNSNTYSNIEIAKLLLKHKANVDLRNINGSTALIIASAYADDLNEEGIMKLTKILLEYGANINLQDNDGDPALLSVQQEYSNIAKLLKVSKLLLEYDAIPSEINYKYVNIINNILILNVLS